MPCTRPILSVHPWMATGLFPPFVDNAAVNMRAHTSLQDPALNSFGHIPRSRIAGSWGKPPSRLLWRRHTVATAAAPSYFLTRSAQGFPCLCIPANPLLSSGV